MSTIEQNSSIINDDISVFTARKNAKSIKTGMTIYENRTMPTKIPANRPFIVRLNANSFTKMNFIGNKNAKCSDFETSYSLAIINTARALLNDTMFKPRMIYTVADEIILLFNSADILQGCTQKYLSLLSSKASSYFYKFFDHKDKNNKLVVFEGRIVFFPADKNYEIVNYFLWRSGKRNIVTEFYRSKGNKTFLHKKSNAELTQLYKDQFKNEMDETVIPEFLKYGLFMKKCLYSACYITEVLSESNVVNVCDAIWSMQFKYGNDILDEMLAKYYNQDKWEVISHKTTTKYWKTYTSEAFDVTEDETQPDTHEAQICSPVVCMGQKEEYSPLYMIIPSISFLMLFMHCFMILTKTPLENQLYHLGLVGVIYNIFLTFVYKKECIQQGVLFWVTIMTLLNCQPIYKYIFSKIVTQIMMSVIIVYGFYTLLTLSVYLFYKAEVAKQHKYDFCLKYKRFIKPVPESTESTEESQTNEPEQENEENELHED